MTITTRSPSPYAGVYPPSLRAVALHDLRPVLPGVVAFGLVLGVTVHETGVGTVAGLVGAAAAYGGSAQLATTTMWHLGAGVTSAVMAGVVVNTRLLLYGAALAPWFRDQPQWFRLLGPQFVLDQTYLAAAGRPDLTAGAFRRYWGWLGFLLLAVWLASVAAGISAGPSLPALPHLALVGTAMFLAMLVPRVVDRPSAVAAVSGGLTAWAVHGVAPEAAILAGAVTGAAGATWSERHGAAGP